MIRRHPRTTRTHTLLPYTTPFRSSRLERARDQDRASGYSLPIRTPGEPEAIFTAARSRDEPLSAEEILTARLLGSVAYDRARELLGEAAKTLTCVPLSPRQVECIALVAQGKSDWEIDQILDRTSVVSGKGVEGR